MTGFARRLLAWYDHHGRRDLPWQGTAANPRTPYRVWVSEVMLQQTRVETVIPYFRRFVAEFMELPALAAADEDRVLALWSGLGYYRRARYLHDAAKLCMLRHGGRLPDDFETLAELPGIGRSTAGAILALACAQRHPILDGNVKRVLSRYHGVRGWSGERAVENTLWAHAKANTPAMRVADYTQAIMDLGATVCTRDNPRCGECPQRHHCVARREGLTTALPARRPARVLPERRAVFIVLRDRRGRILLQRRPPTGVWPRLWSLPEAADDGAARELASRLAVLDGKTATALPGIRHTFTHFRLRAALLEWRNVRLRDGVADARDGRWCSFDDVATLGVPAPVAGFLHAALAAAPRGQLPGASMRPATGAHAGDDASAPVGR